MRLDKYLSNAGIASRSEIKKYLKTHQVTVNDVLVKQGKTQIKETKDIIKIDNQIIQYKPYYYFLLNKPKGYVSANEDDRYPTIMDFFKDLNIKGLSHVGRLDLDTTGAILITNHGKLAHFLISPKTNIKKIYNVTLDKPFSATLFDAFKKGIKLENGEICKPAKLVITSKNTVNIELTEGKYHQVKRMFRALGYEVTNLNREEFAGLNVKNCKFGEYYELNDSEINYLLLLANLSSK